MTLPQAFAKWGHPAHDDGIGGAILIQRIPVVEDDPGIVELGVRNLEAAGYVLRSSPDEGNRVYRLVRP